MSHLKVVAQLLMLTCMGCAQTPQVNRTLTAPFDVSEAYVASGYMGDGEAGKPVQMRNVTGEMPRPGDTDGLCIKVAYQPGAKGWAGVYWLSPANNWGDKPGNRIQGASKITFWAVGAKGGEILEFKAGGVSDKQYRDSFEKSMGSVALTKQWKQYTISLAGQKTVSVLGGFAWLAKATDNPDGLTFYLDAIRYE